MHQKSSYKKRRTANIQNILQLCQDQSIMLPRATAEKKY